jgi:hypothetical protein
MCTMMLRENRRSNADVYAANATLRVFAGRAAPGVAATKTHILMQTSADAAA